MRFEEGQRNVTINIDYQLKNLKPPNDGKLSLVMHRRPVSVILNIFTAIIEWREA